MDKESPNNLNNLKKQLKEITEQYKPVFEKFRNHNRELFARFKLSNTLFDPSNLLTDTTKQLAEYGWFIPMTFSVRQVSNLSNELNANNIKEVDKLMIGYYDKYLNDVKELIIERFPLRKEVLESAFIAHKKKEYNLSIPVFLAQSDGICKELTKVGFFESFKTGDKEHKPRTYRWIAESELDSTYDVMLEPLKHKGGFSKHFSVANPMGVSRHEILHGESTDYGTQLISCKSLSLLNFVGEWVYKAIESTNKLKVR
ncbi:MAG: hypothetical protein ABJH98_09250 [Reichenbachiella sp.]|uniref:hypothetical protein n=1 Tax=Reichenbachiella sp. TaxID=2184521 RepID=UPI003297459D